MPQNKGAIPTKVQSVTWDFSFSPSYLRHHRFGDSRFSGIIPRKDLGGWTAKRPRAGQTQSDLACRQGPSCQWPNPGIHGQTLQHTPNQSCERDQEEHDQESRGTRIPLPFWHPCWVWAHDRRRLRHWQQSSNRHHVPIKRALLDQPLNPARCQQLFMWSEHNGNHGCQ